MGSLGACCGTGIRRRPLSHRLPWVWLPAPRLLLRWWQQAARCLRWARAWMLRKASALFQLRALAQTWLLWSSLAHVATKSCSSSRAPYLSWLGWRNGACSQCACLLLVCAGARGMSHLVVYLVVLRRRARLP